MCPLCRSNDNFLKKHGPRHLKCQNCDLIFLPPNLQLSSIEEKKRYLTHNNDTQDPKYLKYLSQLIKDDVTTENKDILDYGCGPTQGYKALLEPHARVTSYDPYFYPIDLSNQDFDLILCSEALEHFCHPDAEFQNLCNLLRSLGQILIRTELVNESISFESWYYQKDPTHVAFYSKSTMKWIGKTYHLNGPYFLTDTNQIKFEKPAKSQHTN